MAQQFPTAMKQSDSQAAGLPFSFLLRRYARPRLTWIVCLSLLTLLANLLTVAQPAILAGIIASISGPQSASPSTASWLDLNTLGERMVALTGQGASAGTALLVFCGLFVAFSVFGALANYAADYGAGMLRLQMSRQIRLDLLRKIFDQDLAFFHSSRAGELSSRITRDATNTAQGLAPLLRSLLHHLIQFVVYGAYLVSTSVWLTVSSGTRSKRSSHMAARLLTPWR
jgi:ABC-type multidrug transport system fused ATPase/permease subunit